MQHFIGLNGKAFSLPNSARIEAENNNQNNQITPQQIDRLGSILDTIYPLQYTSWARAINEQLRTADIKKRENRLKYTAIKQELKFYLRAIYNWLQSSEDHNSTDNKRMLIASKLSDQITQCIEGFHEHTQEIYHLLQEVATIEELLYQIRTDLAKDFTDRFVAENRINDRAHGGHNRAWILRQAYLFYQTTPQTNHQYCSMTQSQKNEATNQLHQVFRQHYQYHKFIDLITNYIRANILAYHYGEHYEQSYFNGQILNTDI